MKSKKIETSTEKDDMNSETSNSEDLDDKLNIKFVSRVTTEATMIGPKTNKIITKERLIIIIMPLFWIAYNLGIAYCVGHQQLEKRIYFLFFFTLIYAIFFKKQIYRHQKLALIITIIVF